MLNTWTEKERILPLGDVQLEGMDGGMVDDMKFRPNKYFHPIDDIKMEDSRCVMLYQREFSPVDGKVSLEQVRHVIRGVIDGQHKLAQDQTFYLYPGVEAFGFDRRNNLRIGLINARPHKDHERSEQELNVDAFSQLIANHCPDAHKRVVSYRQKILTLRHLLQVLEGHYSRSFGLSILIFFVLASSLVSLLYHWGPPRVRGSIQSSVDATLNWGKRMFRSSSTQWDVTIREERRRWEYRHDPMPIALILNPTTKSAAERSQIHRHLKQVMHREFGDFPKANYQLYVHRPAQFTASYQKEVPLPSRFPRLMQDWKRSCFMMYAKKCPQNSWLLLVSNYRGGFRPLVDALKAALKNGKRGGVSMKYRKVVSSVTLGWVPPPRRRTATVSQRKVPVRKAVKSPTPPNKGAKGAPTPARKSGKVRRLAPVPRRP